MRTATPQTSYRKGEEKPSGEGFRIKQRAVPREPRLVSASLPSPQPFQWGPLLQHLYGGYGAPAQSIITRRLVKSQTSKQTWQPVKKGLRTSATETFFLKPCYSIEGESGRAEQREPAVLSTPLQGAPAAPHPFPLQLRSARGERPVYVTSCHLKPARVQMQVQIQPSAMPSISCPSLDETHSCALCSRCI